MADGLVESRGRGSFVTGDALVEPPNTLMGLTELGRSRGLEAERRRARGERPPRDARRGRDVQHRARRRAVRAAPRAQCSTGCRSRSTTTASRCASRRSSRTSTSPRPRCTTCSTAPGIRPAARTTSSRPAPPLWTEAELLGLAQGAPVLFATTVAIGAGRQGRRPRPHRVPRRPLPIPSDADAPRTRSNERQAMRRRSLCAVLPLAARDRRRRVRRDPGGGQARTSSRRRTPAEAVKTDGFEELGPRHAEGHLGRGLRRPARRAQGADRSSSRRSTRTSRSTSRSATSRAGSSRPSSSPRATTRRTCSPATRATRSTASS